MTEDIASPQMASLLYKLGPHYLGSLQAPQVRKMWKLRNFNFITKKMTTDKHAEKNSSGNKCAKFKIFFGEMKDQIKICQ